MSAEIPQIYTHSLKLEDTSKGLRISVHVYTNNEADVIEQTFTTYLKARQTALTFLSYIETFQT